MTAPDPVPAEQVDAVAWEALLAPYSAAELLLIASALVGFGPRLADKPTEAFDALADQLEGRADVLAAAAGEGAGR